MNDCEREYIAQILEKLPEDSRIVIFLHYWRGIEFENIAEVLGVRPRQVEFIHRMTLQILSKVFVQKLNDRRRFLKEVAA